MTVSGAARQLGYLAGSVLVVVGGGCVGLAGLALSRAGSGLSTDQAMAFVVVPLISASLCMVALRLRREHRIAAALLTVSSGLAILMAEALLIAAAWLSGSSDGGANALEGFDTRSPKDVVMALRSSGVEAYPRVPGNVLVELSPVLDLGSSTVRPIGPAPGLVTVFLCNEARATPVVYESDRHGFNNPDSLWGLQAVDLALIGDSYMHGVCVDHDDQPAASMRSSRSVLNLGISGAGPLQELAVLREYAAPVEPEVVIWVYYEGNDLWDLRLESSRAWLTRYLEPQHHQGLAQNADILSSEFGALLDSLMAIEHYSTGDPPSLALPEALAQLPRLRMLRRVIGFEIPFPSRGSPLGALPDVLARAQSDVEGWGGKMILVYMPAYLRFEARFGEGVPGRRALLRAADSLGVDVLDLVPVFEATGRPKELWAHPRGHLTAEGYRLTAETILAALGS